MKFESEKQDCVFIVVVLISVEGMIIHKVVIAVSCKPSCFYIVPSVNSVHLSDLCIELHSC